jgi:hypothetical protein
MTPPATYQHVAHSPSADSFESECPEVRIDIPLAHELDVDRLLEPRASHLGTLRCRVRRLRDKNMLELFIEEGNVFVLSASRSGKDWLVSEQQHGCEKRKHLARLKSHAKDRSYTLCRRRFEENSGPPELLVVRHSTQNLSEDLPELNIMQLAMPRPPKADLDWPCGLLASRMAHSVERREPAGEDLAIVQSRVPKWNARTETYELPFGGRANWASARNFQLVERGGQPERVVLLYGKMEEDEFALDFSYPLSILNAFAIVLTTSGW